MSIVFPLVWCESCDTNIRYGKQINMSAHPIQERLSDYVRRVVKEKDLRYRQVAERSGGGISASTVSDIISGRTKEIRSGTISALSRGLGVPQSELMEVIGGRVLPSEEEDGLSRWIALPQSVWERIEMESEAENMSVAAFLETHFVDYFSIESERSRLKERIWEVRVRELNAFSAGERKDYPTELSKNVEELATVIDTLDPQYFLNARRMLSDAEASTIGETTLTEQPNRFEVRPYSARRANDRALIWLLRESVVETSSRITRRALMLASAAFRGLQSQDNLDLTDQTGDYIYMLMGMRLEEYEEFDKISTLTESFFRNDTQEFEHLPVIHPPIEVMEKHLFDACSLALAELSFSAEAVRVVRSGSDIRVVFEAADGMLFEVEAFFPVEQEQSDSKYNWSAALKMRIFEKLLVLEMPGFKNENLIETFRASGLSLPLPTPIGLRPPWVF